MWKTVEVWMKLLYESESNVTQLHETRWIIYVVATLTVIGQGKCYSMDG